MSETSNISKTGRLLRAVLPITYTRQVSPPPPDFQPLNSAGGPA